MGIVFKPYVTRPLPKGARIITRKVKGKPKRFATWTEGDKQLEAPATSDKAKRPGIVVHAATYTAQFTDANGVKRRVSTGCRDRDAARATLARLESQAEKVRSGIITAPEAAIADHANAPIDDHLDAYLADLACKRGKGARKAVNPVHVANVGRSLRLALAECGWRRLRDLNRDSVTRWVRRMIDLPDGQRLAPRTINMRLCSLTAWGNWLVESGRIIANPFGRLRKLDEADDCRRQRRALTTEELRRLLAVARLRPVAEYGREKVRVIDEARPAASRATWERAPLTFDTIHEAAEHGRERLRLDVAGRLDEAGRERALVYAVLLSTGLRKGELSKLTVGDLILDEGQPVILLPGTEAKNGTRATLPLRDDVAVELRQWITDKTEAVCQKRIGVAGRVAPPANMPLFNVPTGLLRILNRDLAAAGIPKCDERGRTVDVHAMRHTFGTHLVAAGVMPAVAQRAMRHSSLELTMKVYTDPKLLDVAGAMAALPDLRSNDPTREESRATGTNDAIPPLCFVAPPVAPKTVERDQNESQWVNSDDESVSIVETRNAKNRRETRGFPTVHQEWAKGLEPSTSSLGS